MACFLLAAYIPYTAYGLLGAAASIIVGGIATILACVIFGEFEIKGINTIERGFCDIGEHVQTTVEYNTAYHIPFEGVVLEHVKGDMRVVVDRNGTQQTFHIRWLEEG
jgi:ethanolamine ammonia-lyase large subunit